MPTRHAEACATVMAHDNLSGPPHHVHEVAFAVDRLRRRSAQIEHEQSHRYSEDAVAQRSQPLDTLPGDAVVGHAHAQSSVA